MWGLVRILGLFLLLGVLSCNREDEAPLRVGTLIWPGVEPLFLARELGFLDEESIRLVEYSSTDESNRAFRNGMIDAVNVTLDMALLLEASGFEPRVVLVLDFSHGADALLARPEVRSLADLRGRRVAIEDLAVSAYILGRALEEAGLKPSDLQIIRIPLDEQVEAYASGEVDAVVTYEPFVGRLRASGAHTLFDSRQLPGEITDVLVVRADVLEKHPEQVEHLLQGWFRALGHLEAHREDAVARMSRRLDTSPTELSAILETLRMPSLEENLTLLGGPSSPLADSARRLQRLMLAEGLLREPVRPERMLDARFLEKLQEEPR